MHEYFPLMLKVPSGGMVTCKSTRNLQHAFNAWGNKAPPDQWVAVHITTQKRPESKHVRALQVMKEIILLFVTSKEAWQFNFLLESSGGGPTIAPTLKDLDRDSNSTLLQAAEAIPEKYSVVKIKVIRIESFFQSFAEDVLER